MFVSKSHLRKKNIKKTLQIKVMWFLIKDKIEMEKAAAAEDSITRLGRNL